MALRRSCSALIYLGLVAGATAQSFYLPDGSSTFLTPKNRSSPATEYSAWDVFYSPSLISTVSGVEYTDGFNYPDMAAPYGMGQTASEALAVAPRNAKPSDPFAFWDDRNPTISQTAIRTPDVFIIGAGIAGNIYSPAGAIALQLQDRPDFAPGSVNLQWQTDGTLVDYHSLELTYVSGGVTHTIAPQSFVAEYKATNNLNGFSFGNRISAQWNLTGLNIADYTLTWKGAGSSVSLQEVVLDTSAYFVEITPSTRVYAGGGVDHTWSNPANWEGQMLPVNRGNLNLSGGSGVVLDGTSREISLLTITAPGSFGISATGGAKLQLNTGLTASPATAATYTISAPLVIGAFNLWDVGAKADLTLSGVIEGTVGFYKSGDGILRLKGNNTFAGQVAYDGGRTYISGTNSYAGGTNIFSGQVILLGDAPSNGAGALGTSGQITVGGGTGGAALLLDGARTVGRQLVLNNGSDTKVLGGQNTGSGANFTGQILMGSSASNVQVHAEQASDVVNFSSSLSGGTAATSSVTKTGAGLVNFSGTKTYQAKTIVEEGTLQVAAGTTLTGNGDVTVQAGAQLLVHGTLSGSGALALQSGGLLGGSGTINRSFLVANGGILSPGSGIGRLATKAETWGAGGRLCFEINGVNEATATTGVNWDLLDITGLLALAFTSTEKFTLQIKGLTAAGVAGTVSDFNTAGSYSWKFASATGGISGFDATGFEFDVSDFAGATADYFSVSQVGQDLLLNYSPVPEPATGSLAALGGGAWALRRRRRSARR